MSAEHRHLSVTDHVILPFEIHSFFEDGFFDLRNRRALLNECSPCAGGKRDCFALKAIFYHNFLTFYLKKARRFGIMNYD